MQASVDDIAPEQKKGTLGFFIPGKNIFVPCSSKEQYFYLKVSLGGLSAR